MEKEEKRKPGKEKEEKRKPGKQKRGKDNIPTFLHSKLRGKKRKIKTPKEEIS